MFLVRFFELCLRVVGSFILVFILQIQFDGKSLESYINNFNKKFIVTKTLQKVSHDGVKFVQSFSDTEEDANKKKITKNKKAFRYFRNLASRISLPLAEKEPNPPVKKLKTPTSKARTPASKVSPPAKTAPATNRVLANSTNKPASPTKTARTPASKTSPSTQRSNPPVKNPANKKTQ